MKNISYLLILAVLLLGGCAKVTQDGVPCSSARPATPAIENMIVPQGTTTTITVPNFQYGNSTSVIFTGPNGFFTSSTTGQLYLDFSNNTNYGQYTATYAVNGCRSNPDTFDVVANFIGNPTCTVTPANYNLLVGSNSSSFAFSPGTLSNSGSNYCSYGSYDINAITTNNAYILDINLPATPAAGSYCVLVASCSPPLGQAFATLTYNNTSTITYESTGGNVYFNTISGQTYATFCAATFVNVSNGSSFTLTGNLEYF